jgi:hypothetical protein
VVYPVAGEKTLRDLVAEYKSSGPAYRRTVQTTLRASYTGHYRRGLIKLLEVLEFCTGSSACQPVIAALALIRRRAAAGSLTYYPAGEHVPVHAGITEDWKPLVYRTDQHGRQRVVRMAYEVVTFQALRAAAEEGDRRPVGHRAADRHAEGGRAPDRLPVAGRRLRPGRQPGSCRIADGHVADTIRIRRVAGSSSEHWRREWLYRVQVRCWLSAPRPPCGCGRRRPA